MSEECEVMRSVWEARRLSEAMGGNDPLEHNIN